MHPVPVAEGVRRSSRVILTCAFYPGNNPCMEAEATYTAFSGHRMLASGPLAQVLSAAKAHLSDHPHEHPLFLADDDGRQVDFDLRGKLDEVLARLTPAPTRPGPGRPRLGVVSREVSLLPRHWQWLEEQPNGASATLRRLVDEARRREGPAERARRSARTADRFMHAIAGDLSGYEEASRALYAGDRAAFEALTASWPPDVRSHALRLAEPAFHREAP